MIKLIKQKADNDCFLASIAMIVGAESIDAVFSSEFQERVAAENGTYGSMTEKALTAAGLEKDKDYWCVYTEMLSNNSYFRPLLNGRKAILQIPSLNNEKGQHAVVWTGTEILDPSNKQIYRWIKQCFPTYVWIFNELK